MSTRIEQKSNPESGSAKRTSVPAGERSLARLNPMRLSWRFGATGVVFCLGCTLTMATVLHETAVDTTTTFHAKRNGKTFYYSSDHCRQKILSTPAGAKPKGKSGGCCG